MKCSDSLTLWELEGWEWVLNHPFNLPKIFVKSPSQLQHARERKPQSGRVQMRNRIEVTFTFFIFLPMIGI